jgi:hypothetical protein
MEPFSFTGSYADEAGEAEVRWRVEPSQRRGPWPGFELRAVIRGVEFWGYDFDGLEPVSRQAAVAAGFHLAAHGDVDRCVLRGDLPCAIEQAGVRKQGTVRFSLTLDPAAARQSAPRNLTLTTTIGQATYSVEDDWFEDGLQRLQGCLPDDVRLICCFTCLFSDYSPGGHGLLGMLCHRGAKEEYLAVRSKREYWSVPVTEDVLETYLCPEFEPRIPGTGYRG